MWRLDDADVQVVDEQEDGGAGLSGAEADVVQPAVVAQGDRCRRGRSCRSDPVVGRDDRAGRDGFGSGGIGLGGGAAAERTVRPDGVVVGCRTGSAGVAARPRVASQGCAVSHFFSVWWNRSTLPQVWGW